MTQPYFLHRARDVFSTAGGDPALAGPLAAWAQETRESGRDRDNPRAIVAEDGTIVATAHRVGRDPSAWYIDETEQTTEWGVASVVTDMALGAIKRAIGQRVIEVSASDVCRGPGIKNVDDLQSAAERYHRHKAAFEAEQLRFQATVGKAAAAPKANLRQIAIVAGVARQSVYTWRDNFLAGAYDDLDEATDDVVYLGE